MKKSVILKFIAFILLIFTLKSVADTDDSNYCRECCQRGRFASSECANKCNNCRMYNDEAAAENHDYPPNDDVERNY